MPDNQPDILWCCHVRGPDDVYASPDYETALAWADMMNSLNWECRTDAPPSWYECLIKAAPAVWMWSKEEHESELPKSLRQFSRPICPHGVCPTFGLCRYACKDKPPEQAATPEAEASNAS